MPGIFLSAGGRAVYRTDKTPYWWSLRSCADLRCIHFPSVFAIANINGLCPAQQKHRIIQGSNKLFFLSQNHKASITENKYLW